MIAASLYILVCTTRNRTRRWLKRLKEPRYSVAVVAGAAYLWFVFRAQARRRAAVTVGPGARVPQMLLAEFPALTVAGPAIAGFALLVVSAASWLIPGTGGLLDFTRAEGQFLFTAPVSTRMLLAHRIIRSQLRLLLGPLIFVAMVPFGSDPERVRMAITLWVALFTARLYFSGAAVARARLRGPGAGRLARLPLGIVLAALFVVGFPLARALFGSPILSVGDAVERVSSVAAQPNVHAALWPFEALIRPAFAASWTDFFRLMPFALGVSGLVTAWVLVSAPAFEDIIRNVSDQPADRPQRKQASYRARNIWWTLAPTGRHEVAFAWKSAVQTFRIAEVRILIRVALVFVWIAFVSSMQNNASAAFGAAAMIAAGVCTIFGPLILRIDLRQDLGHLEVLKTWPVRAAALVRGEMLWPAAMLSVIVWALTITAFSLSAVLFSSVDLPVRASVAAGFCLLAPALIATQLTIHNSAALIFPAWVAFGSFRSRGVDAMGQRLIVVGGTVLLITLAALPGALLGGIVWLALNRFIGPAALVLSAGVCAMTMGIEVLFVTEAIGPAYEKLDLTAIERAE